MKDTKNTKLVIKDKYGDCLNDSSLDPRSVKNDRNKPEGFVEIYETQPDGSDKLLGRHNLVLYNGRECIAQRMVDTNNASATTNQNQYICWFGIGSGGTTVGDPLAPLSVSSLNTDLANEVPIHENDDDSSTTYTDRQDGVPGDYYKKRFDNIDFNTDPSNDNQYLITKITMVIDNDDCNDTTLVGSRYNNHLNEAGLFVCSTNQGGSAQVGPWEIYSRVTFPTIVKDVSRQLTLVWYLYF